MTFEERKEKLQKDLEETCNELELNIYAANAVLPNGEVIPIMKVKDMKPEEEKEVVKELKEEKDGDKTKK